jgi:LAO/AO transport system kinase
MLNLGVLIVLAKHQKRRRMTNASSLSELVNSLHKGDRKALARCISLVENEAQGYREIMTSLRVNSNTPVIGVTGPPGGGKSTFINAFTKTLLALKYKIGVIAIDPSSPFHLGALLGDRIRMGEHTNNPDVFIRSLASRGALGGLSVKTLEVLDVVRAAGFDFILVETVGVGQSEIEVAGLSDTTILLLNPESGDGVQALKSGIMEIADIFIVNKGDRPGADAYVNTLIKMVHERPTTGWSPPVIKISATEEYGMDTVLEQILLHTNHKNSSMKVHFLTEKAFQLIQYERMKTLDKKALQVAIAHAITQPDFNLYTFVSGWNLTLQGK